jgi:GR25 family glycosyltransferase involved in LPS biosynthesis
MFKTYVINLEKDIENFNVLQTKLNKIGINPIRFNAIYGKEIKDFSKYDKYISNYSKYFSPRGLVGCALSHYTLLDQIYSNYLKNKDTEYTLILEDDAIPLIKDKKVIEDIIPRIPKDCDILLLYCQGICNYNKTNNEFIKKSKINILGSTASYLVKNSSIPKLLKKKIYFHIDLQWYNTEIINFYIYHKMLFNVDENESYNINIKLRNLFKFINTINFNDKFNNSTLNELLSFKIFRIPLLGIELSGIEIIIYIIIMIIIFTIYKSKKSINKLYIKYKRGNK